MTQQQYLIGRKPPSVAETTDYGFFVNYKASTFEGIVERDFKEIKDVYTYLLAAQDAHQKPISEMTLYNPKDTELSDIIKAVELSRRNMR